MKRTLTLLLLTLIILGNTTVNSMQMLSTNLIRLLALSLNPADWASEKNKVEIENKLGVLLKASHELKGMESESEENKDPSFSILAPVLSEQIALTLSAYRLQQFAFARRNLLTVGATCFGCHSKEPESRNFMVKGDLSTLGKLEKIDQARFRIALRQVDQGLQLYREILSTPDLPRADIDTWTKALRESMTLIYRVKRDPDQALALLEPLKKLEKLPYFISKEIGDWEKHTLAWSREKRITLASEKDLYSKIQKLLKEAQKIKKYPMDHSSDPLFLRASSLLYEFIRKFPSSKTLSEAMFLQGMAHETVESYPFEDLHELFYESCIRRSPHTMISEKCYGNLERSIYLGFTGSSGTHIPVEAQNKLLELWGIAFVPDGYTHPIPPPK